MRISFGLSSYERAEGDLPALPVINMYAEKAPTEEGQVVLQSRRGVVDNEVTLGDGPVDQLFQRDSVLSSALFGVSDGTLYSGGTSIGAIDGTGHVSIAGYESFLFAAAGGGLWGYDGSALGEIAFPDDADVTKVIVGASRAIVIREDTGKFYWSSALGTTIGPLNFATAESQPDDLLDCLFIDDILILFGAETVEFWPNVNDDTLPFQPLEGRVFEKGVKATGAATAIGSTFAWVTNTNEVCVQDVANVISNEGLEARIAASTTVRLFQFFIDGTELLALRLDGETQVYNPRTQMWSEFASYGQGNWIPQCYAGGVFGSSVDGKTLVWGDDYSDLGSVLERRWRAGLPFDAAGISISNVQVRCNVGQTGFLTGQYADPVIEMRMSRDAGQTWGAWKQASLGQQGQYRDKAQWRALGMASYPGLFMEFRVTDPVPFRLSAVDINLPYGGR